MFKEQDKMKKTLYKITCRGHWSCHSPNSSSGHTQGEAVSGITNTPGASRRLAWAGLLNLSFAILEFIGGYLASSVALTSDAIHDLGDSLSLALAWLLEKISNKKSSAKFTYGYRRLSVLSALISSVIIMTSAIFIMVAAIERLWKPRIVDSELVIWFSILGILINSIGFFTLSRGSSLNEKVLKYHLLEDVLGWVLVLIGAFVIKRTQIYWIDSVLALLIGAWIFWNLYRHFLSSLNVFLQAWPEGLDVERIRNLVMGYPEIADVHHIHGWSLDGEAHVLSFHVALRESFDLSMWDALKNKIKSELKKYGSFVDIAIELDIMGNCSDLTHD